MSKSRLLLQRTLQTKQPEKVVQTKSGSCSLFGIFLGQIDPKPKAPTPNAPDNSDNKKGQPPKKEKGGQPPKKAVIRVIGIPNMIINWLDLPKDELPYEPDISEESKPSIRFITSSSRITNATKETAIEPQPLPAYDDRYKISEGDILYLSTYTIPICSIGQPVTAIGVHFAPAKSNTKEGEYIFFLSCVSLSVSHEHETSTWPYEWKFPALFFDPSSDSNKFEGRWPLPEKLSRFKNEVETTPEYQKAHSGMVYLDGGFDSIEEDKFAQKTHYKGYNKETSCLEDGPSYFSWKDAKTQISKCFMPAQVIKAYIEGDDKIFTDEIKISLFDESILGTGITNLDDWKSTWKEPIPCQVLVKVDNIRTLAIASNYFALEPRNRIFDTKVLACCWLVYKDIKTRCVPVTPGWVLSAYNNRRKNPFFKTPNLPSKKFINYLNTDPNGLIRNISETIPEDQSFDLEVILNEEIEANESDRKWFFACKVDVSPLAPRQIELLRSITDEKLGDSVMNSERITVQEETLFINLGPNARAIIYAYKKNECEEMEEKLANYLDREKQKWKQWPEIYEAAKKVIGERMINQSGDEFNNTIEDVEPIENPEMIGENMINHLGDEFNTIEPIESPEMIIPPEDDQKKSNKRSRTGEKNPKAKKQKN